MEILTGCPGRICFNCVSLKLAVTQIFWLSRGTTVINCWPTETFCPGCADLCPMRPLTGATMVVYCKFNCACCKFAAALSACASAARALDLWAEICWGRVSALRTAASAWATLDRAWVTACSAADAEDLAEATAAAVPLWVRDA